MRAITLDTTMNAKRKEDLHKILQNVKSTAKKINVKNSVTKTKQNLRELKEFVNQAEELLYPKINILQNISILQLNMHRDDDVFEENDENDLENEKSRCEKWVPKPSDFCVPPNMNNIIVFDKNSKPGEVLIPGDIYVPEHYKKFEEIPFKIEEYRNRPVDENNVFMFDKKTTNLPIGFASGLEGLKKFNTILAKFLNLPTTEEPTAVEVKSPILTESENSNSIHLQETPQGVDLSSDEEIMPSGKARKSLKAKKEFLKEKREFTEQLKIRMQLEQYQKETECSSYED